MDKKIFEYLNPLDISSWIRSAFDAVFVPKKFFKELGSKTRVELLYQYGFYFIVLSLFYILISSDTQKAVLYRRTVLDIVLSLNFFIPASISVYIFSKRKFKDVVCYFISLYFVFTTCSLVCLSLFLILENYKYQLFLNILLVVLSIYVNYVIAFYIGLNRIQKWLFIVFNYLLLNVVYFIGNVFVIDKGAQVNISDPIISEFYAYEINMDLMDDLPNTVIYTVYKDNLQFGFSTCNLKDTIAVVNQGDMLNTRKYQKRLDDNLAFVKENKPQYYRNKEIFDLYTNYILDIKDEITQEFYSKEDFRSNGYKMTALGIPVDTILVFSRDVDMEHFILKRNDIVKMRNALVEAESLASMPKKYYGLVQFGLTSIIVDKIKNKNKGTK